MMDSTTLLFYTTLFQLQMDEEFTSLRAIKELPAAAESSIREALKEFENEKPAIVEAYIHPNNSFIVLDPGLTDHVIVEECTADFANKTIVNIYYNHDEHLYQIEPRSANEIVWYHSRQMNPIISSYCKKFGTSMI